MRNIININENWKFIREDAGLPAAYPADWSNVNLPHTWNAVDGNEGAANWFTAMGDVELDDGPMEFPKGKMSIKTKLMDIYKNEEAWEFVSKMMGGFKLDPDHPMWNMVGNFNMETLMGMNGAPDEKMIKMLNKQLNKFDIVE